MKKLLLSALTIAGFAVTAQDCVDPNGFNEDFTSAGPTAAGDLVLGWWGKTSAAGTENNGECSGAQTCIDFSHTPTRSGNGDLELSVTQPLNGWTPIGFSLSDQGNTKWVNVSSSNQVEVSLTNDGQDGIEVYFSFISDGTTGANAKLATATSTGSLYGGVVAAGATMTQTFDVSAGRKHTWIDVNNPTAVSNCTNGGGTVAGSYCLEDKGFDATKLSGIEFSINGQGASVNGSWAQPAITNHPVKIHYIRGGNYAALNCSNGTEELVNNMSVYPNPATDVLNVKFDATTNATVQLTDLTGKVVAVQNTVAGANNVVFNTAAVTAGVYLVNIASVNGNTTQKVIIK